MSQDIGGNANEQQMPTNAVSAINAPAGVVIWGGKAAAMEALLSTLPMKKTSDMYDGPLSISDVIMSMSRHGIEVTRRASKKAQVAEIMEAIKPTADLPLFPASGWQLSFETAQQYAALGVFGKSPGQPMRLVRRRAQEMDNLAALAAFIKNGGHYHPGDVEDVPAINGNWILKPMRGSRVVARKYATGSYSVQGTNGTDSMRLIEQHLRLGCIKNDVLAYGETAECRTFYSGVPSWVPIDESGPLSFDGDYPEIPCPTCGGPTTPMVRKDFSTTASRFTLMPVFREDSGEWLPHWGPTKDLRWVHLQHPKSGGSLVLRMKTHCEYDRAENVRRGFSPDAKKSHRMGGRIQRVLFHVADPDGIGDGFNVMGWALVIGPQRGIYDPTHTDNKVCEAIIKTMRIISRNAETASKVREDIANLSLLMKSL